MNFNMQPLLPTTKWKVAKGRAEPTTIATADVNTTAMLP